MQMLTVIKEGIDSNAIIVGKFNTPLTLMDRLSRQKINRPDVLNIYRARHPKAEYTFFPIANEHSQG